VALKKDYSDRLPALLHVDGDALGGRDKVVVLRGTFHGDLVRPPAHALERPRKALLILIVQEQVGMCSLRALVNSYFRSKLSLTLSQSLGDVIIIFDPSSIG
jgi:hypothetical protein